MSELVDVQFVEIDGYNIKLSASNNHLFVILSQIPKIINKIYYENKFVSNYLKTNRLDLIISDNRYGFRNKKVKSIFITHQTYIKTPLKIKLFEKILNKINTILINKFNECWIPDFEDNENLSGELSHKNKSIKNQKFIGILSRFNEITDDEKTIKYLIILSGPEPQRTIFENLILEQLAETNFYATIVRGTIKNKLENTKKISFLNLANKLQISELASKSEKIISRSGYTSIMDYYKMREKVILVPTHGQTEQEYLANYLSKQGLFKSVSQNNFDIRTLHINV